MNEMGNNGRKAKVKKREIIKRIPDMTTSNLLLFINPRISRYMIRIDIPGKNISDVLENSCIDGISARKQREYAAFPESDISRASK